MSINITLVVLVILLIVGVKQGYSTGLIMGVAHLISLVAALITLSFILMLTASFRAGNARNTVFTLIVLAIFGAVYGGVKWLLRSFKAMVKLPILQFLDSLLGIVTGVIWVLILFVAVTALASRNYLGPVSSYIMNDVNNNLVLRMLCKFNFFI